EDRRGAAEMYAPDRGAELRQLYGGRRVSRGGTKAGQPRGQHALASARQAGNEEYAFMALPQPRLELRQQPGPARERINMLANTGRKLNRHVHLSSLNVSLRHAGARADRPRA